MNPTYTRPRINPRNDSYVDSQAESNGANPSEMKDVDFLICCPTVLGFCFDKNSWMGFAVADLSPVEWSSAAFKNLKIPSRQRDMLLALTKTGLSLVPSVPLDDFVIDKGRGLNVLLYGDPGLGKTFTVEALAEHLERPLYRVPASELIDHSSSIFKVASHFRAIVLVDQAEVILQGRLVGEARNHSVTAFLRDLEYLEGVLFLTANRVNKFDDAILNRIHYKLEYEGLSREFRRALWENFLSNVGSARLSRDELHKLEGLNVTPREIKTLVIIAHALATVSGDRVSYTHLEQAATSDEEFARAFNRTGRLETMYN
ncbi:hypothetical protein EMCG_08220 [[Emmonsia] crescens]|uniref:AAA+ ATPase domain-containing protein n=1 Tax=[Emmonsia] crescens TaxID=73230 RepID=A0A0G2JAN1_9EURO|nr:hypothetical protein EMCG_08220 [Emmonsia crescens UAMH 3008]